MGSLKLVIIFGLVCCVLCENTKLKEIFSWKKVDFDFPDENARQEALQNEEFIPENNLPLGIERWKNKLFVTLPRWKKGTAATLTYIDLNKGKTEKSPKLKPYPDWETHKQNKIISVFRLNVDVCDRLWLVDCGIDGIISEQPVKKRDVNIQIYDLKTDKQIKDYTIPKTSLKPNAFLANIVVETSKKNCNEAYAYIPDLGENSLVVYNLKDDDSWVVTHHYFSMDPTCGNYNIGGINFQWRDGIFGVALSGIQADGYRTLYFHAMSSYKEFSVSTKILRNKQLITGQEKDFYHNFTLLGNRGENSQSSASAFDEKTNILIYTLLNKNAVGCFNTKNKEYSFKTQGLIASDNVTMVFPNDLKIDKNRTLWVLTDRIPTFLYSQMDWNDVNFRILSAPVDQAIKGTICESSSSLVVMNWFVFVFLLTFLLRL